MNHVMEADDDTLYVFGGKEDDVSYINSLEMYNTQTEQWSILKGELTIESAASLVESKTIFITGGIKDGKCYNRIFAFDTQKKTFENHAQSLPVESAYHFCGRLVLPQLL